MENVNNVKGYIETALFRYSPLKIPFYVYPKKYSKKIGPFRRIINYMRVGPNNAILVAVDTKNQYGLIDLRGKIVMPFIFHYIYYASKLFRLYLVEGSDPIYLNFREYSNYPSFIRVVEQINKKKKKFITELI